jgi:hypothetical protein
MPAAAARPEPMELDGGPGPDWTRLPADVVGALLRGGVLGPRDAARVMATCSQVRAGSRPSWPHARAAGVAGRGRACRRAPGRACVAPPVARAKPGCAARPPPNPPRPRRPVAARPPPAQWRAAAKEQLTELSPIYFGAPCRVAPAAFGSVTSLACRALRPRGFGAAAPAAAAPNPAPRGDAAALLPLSDAHARRALQAPTPRPQLFLTPPPLGALPAALAAGLLPRAASVDLSGQALPAGAGAALGALPHLAELQLRSCTIELGDLSALLSGLRAAAEAAAAAASPGRAPSPGGGARGSSGGGGGGGAPGLRLLGVADLRVVGAPRMPPPGAPAVAEAVAAAGLPPTLETLMAGLVRKRGRHGRRAACAPLPQAAAPRAGQSRGAPGAQPLTPAPTPPLRARPSPCTQFLRPKQPPQAQAKQPGRLMLRGRLAALLSPLRQLKCLGLEEQGLDESDWEAVCRATTLEVGREAGGTLVAAGVGSDALCTGRSRKRARLTATSQPSPPRPDLRTCHSAGGRPAPPAGCRPTRSARSRRCRASRAFRSRCAAAAASMSRCRSPARPACARWSCRAAARCRWR